MKRTRRSTRRLAAALALAFGVLGWMQSVGGRFTLGAVLEREHLVSLTLEHGHVDLLLEHELPHAHTAGWASDEHAGHVLELRAAADAARSPRVPALDGSAAQAVGPAVAPPFRTSTFAFAGGTGAPPPDLASRSPVLRL